MYLCKCIPESIPKIKVNFSIKTTKSLIVQEYFHSPECDSVSLDHPVEMQQLFTSVFTNGKFFINGNISLILYNTNYIQLTYFTIFSKVHRIF